MMKKNLTKKIITGAIVGALALSTGVIALANTESDTNTTGSKIQSSINKWANNKDRGCFNGMNKNFDSFVEDGTLTQEQADKIKAYMEDKAEERKAEMEKVKDMSEDERKAYFESMKDETREDPLSELVSENIISQEQADTIKESMPENMKRGMRKGPNTKMGNMMHNN